MNCSATETPCGDHARRNPDGGAPTHRTTYPASALPARDLHSSRCVNFLCRSPLRSKSGHANGLPTCTVLPVRHLQHCRMERIRKRTSCDRIMRRTSRRKNTFVPFVVRLPSRLGPRCNLSRFRGRGFSCVSEPDCPRRVRGDQHYPPMLAGRVERALFPPGTARPGREGRHVESGVRRLPRRFGRLWTSPGA